MSISDYRSTYKLRFPNAGQNVSKYLLFTDTGSLVIETEDYDRSYDERYTRIDPADTLKFLDAVGETDRRPEFWEGEPTPQTKALLPRLIKQFSSTDDIFRCWKIIGISGHCLSGAATSN